VQPSQNASAAGNERERTNDRHSADDGVLADRFELYCWSMR
jgi:hypothetical protein